MLVGKYLLIVSFAGFTVALAGCATTTCLPQPNNGQIKQVPIDFNAERIALTRQYRFEHYGIKSSSITIVPQMIVLHWTAWPTAVQSFAEFYPPTLQNRPDIAQESMLNTSTQFLVDKDGTIFQLMPDNWMARHVIGLNNIAIGIENVGGVDGKEDLTRQQVAADVKLIFMLKQKYPTIQYLIGHYEYEQFQNTPLWLEKHEHYRTDKIDPGKKFMQKVRARVRCLGLYSQYSHSAGAS